MDLASPDMTEIREAAAALQRGETDEARARLLPVWEAVGGDPVVRSAAAHFLADTEPEPAGELEWDLRALEAAIGCRDAEDRDPVSADLASFLPSLHLSAANGWRRLGQPDRARAHVAIAAARAAVLPDDDYGRVIRGGLRRLQAALG